MSSITCCFICLATNRRTINIYGKNLQYVYETLANFKITDVECWVCYICHMRLRQCLQLQQLAVQTRGLIDDIFQNKIDIKFDGFGSLLKLSITKMKIVSKEPLSLQVKRETDGKTEQYDDNGIAEDEIREKSINYDEEKPVIKSEGIQESASDNVIQKSKAPKNQVEISQILNVEFVPPNVTYKQIFGENSTEDIQIKLERIDEMEFTGVDHHKERDSCGGRDDTEASDGQKKPFICHVCLKIFAWKSKLVRHMRTHTGERPFTCDVCFKKFPQLCQLKSHKQIHTGEKPHTCDICSKTFSQKSHLNNHKLTHTGEKPYSCVVCSKKFPRKSSLINHTLIHTGERPLSCQICSKKFTQTSELNRHTREHDGVKPFSCDVCSKKFTRKSNIDRHILTHTGYQPFGCDICTKRFASKSSLENHTLIHTGDKKYICHICGKKFTIQRYLNIHLESHTGKKKYSCDVCSKQFTQKSSLNTHKRVH
ncbi:zinc finger protein 391-like isoform X4 [Aricia agestis]|uniref:zinc finger protein 391-like isoform X4 n=1 Tax=Aricia agestis TaxID=91739 RepID=UPI001C207DC5|nr:zinc finger protein 391-like isoform X4 [Aricia agestis]